MTFLKWTMTVIFLCFAVLGLPAYAETEAEEMPAHVAQFSGPQLLEELKKGGYTVYFRHAKTDRKQVDTENSDLEYCETQRNLSDDGRKKAAAIGKALKEAGIPVGNVSSSPYCRCKDTASLALGNGYEVLDDLQFAINAPPEKRKQREETLKNLLGSAPEDGTNNFMVSHTGNLKEAMKIWPKPEGVMVVFKPQGDSHAEYMGMIKPDEWPGMEAGNNADEE